MEDDVEDPLSLEKFTREPCSTKTISHSRSHQNHVSSEPLRRKKKSKLQHSHPCNCQDNIKRTPSAKTRNTDNVESVLEKVEHICNDSFRSGGLKKSQSTFLSPKSAPRCHCKTLSNCHRQQQREINKHDKFTAILNDIVENGMTNEQIEYSDEYLNPPPNAYSDVENDYCVSKCFENHHRPKKNEALKEMNFVMKFKKRENEWAEEDDELRLQREPQGGRAFTNKLPVPRSDSKSPNKLQTSLTRSKRNVEGQRNNKNVLRVETSASHRCIDGETDDDFSMEEELRKELENIPYSRPCRKTTTGRKAKLAKSFEAMRHDDKNVNEKSENFSTLVKADQPDNEDLDLHASKSHILNLIDKALSKEFGPMDEKQNDQKKEDVTRQDPSIEISRVLPGDCCHTLAQTLFSHRETPDYVRHLKALRWKYLDHIQDKLRKLYDLEKILDDCSPPRSSPSTLQSRTSNNEQLKHRARAQTSNHQERKGSTS